MEGWFNKSVFYHIYPLGLCNAERKNNYGEIHHRFNQLYEWTDHLYEMGFNAIYIGPLFESVGHGYETTDYKLVDRRLGDNHDFIEYVKYCHEREIRVVVDGVFNHTGRDFFAFQDLIKNKNLSSYNDWYCNLNFSGNSSHNDGFSYESWRGYQELPRLNVWNEEVITYLLDIVEYWITEFDIDGIRLDCADVLDFNFMKRLRTKTMELKNDFWLMGEVIHGDYSKWISNEMLHSVTDYELWKALYSSHNDHNYFELAHTAKRLFDCNGGIIKDSSLYSFADNHDVSRVATKLNDKRQLIPLYIALFTLPGVPSIYYGSEYAIEGDKDKGSDYDVRPYLKFDDYKSMNCTMLYEYIQTLITIRKKEDALCKGIYTELVLSNRQYAFSRTFENEIIIVAINNDEQLVEMTIPIKNNCRRGESLLTDKRYTIEDESIKIYLQANSGDIIKCLQ